VGVADTATVHDWLTYLAALNVGGLGKDEVELRLAVLAPALAEEFSDEAFTPDTARAVARKHTRYFPTFGELCQTIEPLLQQRRERRRFLALPPPRAESREPYKLPPPPPERTPRHLGRPDREEIRELIQKPLRTVAQQLAELGFAEPPPLKVAAAPIRAETRRGPPVDA
jgi:hypothetical protein